ncbi:MAG: cation transporter [Firmicutes bacterium]|nr:cation transporter [Bacillota bacterium]
MDRFKAANKASILGMIGNIFLFLIKVIVGFISNSQAMIADAFNSASDILSSFMTYIGNRVASKDADEDHNLGHGKAEYIYSMLISIVMFILGSKILIDSILSIINPDKFHFSIWLVIVCIVTIIVKLSLYLYTRNIGKKYNNLLVEANSKDHRNDVVITSCNLVAAICSLYGLTYVDGIVGLGISLWIVYTAIKIYKESYDVLMDKTISSETKDKVLAIIEEHDEVLKIQHFNATPVGYRYMVNFSIFVDGNLSTFESHAIADHLEEEIDEKVPEIYLTVIHVNPMEVKNNKKDTKK